MDYIGIKELKNQAPRIMKAVREEGARYVVTYHGRPTALIVPLDIVPLDEAEVDAPVASMLEEAEIDTPVAPVMDEAAIDAAVAQMMRDALIGLDEDTDLERELAELRKEIAAAWRSPLTAVEAIDEQRR